MKQLVDPHTDIWDICAVEMHVNKMPIIQFGIYKLYDFFEWNFIQYSLINNIVRRLGFDKTPIIHGGDFNIDLKSTIGQ